MCFGSVDSSLPRHVITYFSLYSVYIPSIFRLYSVYIQCEGFAFTLTFYLGARRPQRVPRRHVGGRARQPVLPRCGSLRSRHRRPPTVHHPAAAGPRDRLRRRVRELEGEAERENGRERERERETETESERQRETERDRDRQRQTERTKSGRGCVWRGLWGSRRGKQTDKHRDTEVYLCITGPLNNPFT